MPELPEVETTRRGIAPRLEGNRIVSVNVRNRSLRWPVPADISGRLTGQIVNRVRRRAKYLLLETAAGTALAHLGMSGSLRFTERATAPGRHDHYDIELESGEILRYNDPRRFGALLWAGRRPYEHALLRHLGPEPLSAEFDGHSLYRASRGRKIAIKPHLMNAAIVVGVGNIYASESLFRAGLHPRRPAGRVSRPQMDRLAAAVKSVLAESIEVGGTTLRDFHDGDGRPGYFRMSLQVYDRTGEPCVNCGKPITQAVIGQRSTFYCTRCQR